MKKRKKIVKNEKKIVKKNCKKLTREMSFWQLVFETCLSGFVRFSKKYTRKMSIRGHAFEVLTVNWTRSTNCWQGS